MDWETLQLVKRLAKKYGSKALDKNKAKSAVQSAGARVTGIDDEDRSGGYLPSSSISISGLQGDKAQDKLDHLDEVVQALKSAGFQVLGVKMVSAVQGRARITVQGSNSTSGPAHIPYD